MKRFSWTIVSCVVPVLLAGAIVAWAYYNNGFKLGVDLVGGTILVYEVDENKKLKEYQPEQLAASIKRRIDPTDLYNVTVRPVGATRVEIILPTGGVAQQGEEPETRTDGKRQATAEEVERIKALIAQVGSLEFRILANSQDDDKAIQEAEEYIKDPKNKEKLERLAREGKAPSGPSDGKPYDTSKGKHSYSWIELDRQERAVLNLDNSSESDPARSSFWKEAAEARASNKALRVARLGGDLLYSRPCEDLNLPKDEREKKRFEYFVLTRDPEFDPVTGKSKAITGDYLVNASEGVDEKLRPAVHFRFNSAGGELFREVTTLNKPEGSPPSQFFRFLAIVLDGKIASAPTINAVISTDGIIQGERFTKKEVDMLVSVLRSGALPATLKPQPVSENTMGATLGADTIRAGTTSLVLAFVAVLAFMILYYRFAGLVACAALLANLLLTVGFMVVVNATFTLPGLAGLVLMLGMAVDANVLIYERLREERERGASLALALRNGYDRAFPTIIDTHLSSIFTAIVLYAVGNDQLKGFGISLTVGLLISLFTSLFMTRVIFDIWQSNGWLTKLSMARLFAKPNIDFMSIRYYWFTATILLTIFGITVFLARGQAGLNIDFVGGTAYSGQLTDAMDISDLRNRLNDQGKLKVTQVKQRDDQGYVFEITYQDSQTRKIRLPDPAQGVTTADHEANVKRRAEVLPDLSVEQIFVPSDPKATRTRSSFFTVRTSEKAARLVEASVDRLLGEVLKKIEMKSYQIADDHKSVTLAFTDFASPAQVHMLLKSEMEDQSLVAQAQQLTPPTGVDAGRSGRFEAMRLELTEAVDPAKLKSVLDETKKALAERPQPERLENFDSQLAKETQDRAMYAILASWGAILMYLWFRFGNWTFGLAAVLCLIHDLFFTLGIIAFCHYIHEGMPAVATALGLHDFKIDLPAVAALLTLVGYSVNDTIVVFDRIREVRGKNPALTPQMINDSVNQTLSRTILTSLVTWLVVLVLYLFGGEGVHLFAFVMVVGVIVGTYSSIYIASPLLLIFGEGAVPVPARQRQPQPEGVGA